MIRSEHTNIEMKLWLYFNGTHQHTWKYQENRSVVWYVKLNRFYPEFDRIFFIGKHSNRYVLYPVQMQTRNVSLCNIYPRHRNLQTNVKTRLAHWAHFISPYAIPLMSNEGREKNVWINSNTIKSNLIGNFFGSLMRVEHEHWIYERSFARS